MRRVDADPSEHFVGQYVRRGRISFYVGDNVCTGGRIKAVSRFHAGGRRARCMGIERAEAK